MIKFSEWERKNFIKSSNEPGLSVIFPSREIYFSLELLHLMRLENSTCPKTLDQWYELCHPSDHEKISKLEQIIYASHENFFSLTRKLYCGDGVYRNFRLDAFVQRYPDGRPVKILGNEILGLTAWLADADEGEQIEIQDDSGRTKILEAVRVAGTMTLNDITIKEDLERENLILRHEISRRIFAPFPAPLKNPEDNAQCDMIFNILNENLDAALLNMNILTGSTQLKTLKRSLNSPFLNIAVTGLSGSGKTSLINALTGEKFNIKDIPVIYAEGERKSIKIFYQDGHILELGVRSEDLGVKLNSNAVSRIEITIPGALIPEGVRLIDTPAFDSMTGAAALKNILPEFDFIIYVTPIRSRLKGADFEYLNQLGVMGKELGIIFIITQIDLENEDTEAGKIINTPKSKILRDIDAIKNNFNFNVDVLPISSKIAGGNFYNRNSEAWKNSNIESLINFINILSKNSCERALILRTKRALKIIEELNSDLLKWQLDPVINNLKKLGIRNEKLEIEKTFLTPKFSLNEKNSEGERHLLSSLITSMREHGFKGRFFSLDAFNENRKAVLLSADKNMSMKLFARLSHNLTFENLPEGRASLSEWLCTGEIMPFNCIKLISSISENILISPPDYLLKNFNWQSLFNDYVPVVSVDLARLESGLSDLIHAPYIAGLALNKWVLAFPNAALIINPNDIIKKVKEFSEANGLKIPEFFIYENYKII